MMEQVAEEMPHILACSLETGGSSSSSSNSSPGSTRRRRRHVRLVRLAALVSATAAVAASAVTNFAMQTATLSNNNYNGDLPAKEAENFRTIEYTRKKARVLPSWYGRHPCPEGPSEEDRLAKKVPGDVEDLTKREQKLKKMLKDGEATAEFFDKTIQVFAQRARQEVRWLSVQRRTYLNKAKIWAVEMGIQGFSPSSLTLKLLLLGCGACGDNSGAMYWLNFMKRNNYQPGRLEYNAVIQAHGQDGYPHDARKWMTVMEREGLKPDPRSYAGVIEGWEKIGNRKAMLEALAEMRRRKEEGELGDPSDPRDESLPYIAMARTYAKASDAPRALSVLKVLQQEKIPLTREVHKLRLLAHLKTPGTRRDTLEIEKALADLIRERPANGPLYQSRLANMCRSALGTDRFNELLESFDVTNKDLVANTPSNLDRMAHRRAKIRQALKKTTGGFSARLTKGRVENGYLTKRLKQKRDPVMGKIETGYRVALEDQDLPEFMTLKPAETFGPGPPSV
eukprot:TRINITY_DN81220_c0_g1_i1.p1 TRINITY_DN81220_c0_g1~~TRINITY_DN81220_c0_g1_i1.p1  ORF type:complete len:510 (-),score=139.05 TRINITY_DN81220_c0_g1_i1:236-1765(-)